MSVKDQLFKIIKASSLSQAEIAANSGLTEATLSRAKKDGGLRVSNLETIADQLGYDVVLVKRTEDKPSLSNAASVWSSPNNRHTLKLLPARLANASFKDLLELISLHGLPGVKDTLELIKREIPDKRYSVQKEMLHNIENGLLRLNSARPWIKVPALNQLSARQLNHIENL